MRQRSTLGKLRLAGFGVAAVAGLMTEIGNAQVLYSENFDSLARLGSVNERLGPGTVTRVATDPESVPYPDVFSKTDPTVGLGGTTWEIDNTLGLYDGETPDQTYNPIATTGNTGVPGAGNATYGVNEFEGWSFMSKSWWVNNYQQDRGLFTAGSGTVAVADSDEYFGLGGSDDPVNGGYYNTGLKSPSIAVTGDDFFQLTYDSSWRDESFDDGYGPNPALNSTNNQAVEILAIFDNGETKVMTGWDSANPANPAHPATAPVFKNDTPNEDNATAFVQAPAGATSVRLQFNLVNAADDWWWAVDNLQFENLSNPGAVWSEDFEDVDLQDSQNVRQAFVIRNTVPEAQAGFSSRPDSFAKDPTPIGWSVDNSALPAGTVGQEDIGVYEWEGWSFATLDFWKFADTQRREEFTKCVGNCAIADSDEWTDLGNPGGPMDTLLQSPEINIAGVVPGGLKLSFDSSWRDEDAQTALIEVNYGDGNGWKEILRWESNDTIDDGLGGTIPNPNFHNDNPNESVSLLLNNPAAATAQFRFAYLGGNNNWWWAVDNIVVSAVPEPSSIGLLFLGAIGVSGVSLRRRQK